MDVQMKRGILETCVLTVLHRGDSYGYQLVRDVSEMIEITESTLYPILRRLEAGGLVTAYSVEHNGRLRRYYHITEAGARKIIDFLDEWKVLLRILSSIEAEVKSHE